MQISNNELIESLYWILRSIWWSLWLLKNCRCFHEHVFIEGVKKTPWPKKLNGNLWDRCLENCGTFKSHRHVSVHTSALSAQGRRYLGPRSVRTHLGVRTRTNGEREIAWWGSFQLPRRTRVSTYEWEAADRGTMRRRDATFISIHVSRLWRTREGIMMPGTRSHPARGYREPRVEGCGEV